MARVNVTIPDEVLARARAAGLNVSRTATAGLERELVPPGKIAELDRYLREMEDELGPIPEADRQRAKAWVDGILQTRAARSA